MSNNLTVFSCFGNHTFNQNGRIINFNFYKPPQKNKKDRNRTKFINFSANSCNYYITFSIKFRHSFESFIDTYNLENTKKINKSLSFNHIITLYIQIQLLKSIHKPKKLKSAIKCKLWDSYYSDHNLVSQLRSFYHNFLSKNNSSIIERLNKNYNKEFYISNITTTLNDYESKEEESHYRRLIVENNKKIENDLRSGMVMTFATGDGSVARFKRNRKIINTALKPHGIKVDNIKQTKKVISQLGNDNLFEIDGKEYKYYNTTAKPVDYTAVIGKGKVLYVGDNAYNSSQVFGIYLQHDKIHHLIGRDINYVLQSIFNSKVIRQTDDLIKEVGVRIFKISNNRTTEIGSFDESFKICNNHRIELRLACRDYDSAQIVCDIIKDDSNIKSNFGKCVKIVPPKAFVNYNLVKIDNLDSFASYHMKQILDEDFIKNNPNSWKWFAEKTKYIEIDLFLKICFDGQGKVNTITQVLGGYIVPYEIRRALSDLIFKNIQTKLSCILAYKGADNYINIHLPEFLVHLLVNSSKIPAFCVNDTFYLRTRVEKILLQCDNCCKNKITGIKGSNSKNSHGMNLEHSDYITHYEKQEEKREEKRKKKQKLSIKDEKFGHKPIGFDLRHQIPQFGELYFIPAVFHACNACIDCSIKLTEAFVNPKSKEFLNVFESLKVFDELNEKGYSCGGAQHCWKACTTYAKRHYLAIKDKYAHFEPFMRLTCGIVYLFDTYKHSDPEMITLAQICCNMHYLLFTFIADNYYDGILRYARKKSANLLDFWSHVCLTWMRLGIAPALWSDRHLEQRIVNTNLVQTVKRVKRPILEVCEQYQIYDIIKRIASNSSNKRRLGIDSERIAISNLIIDCCVFKDLRGARTLSQCLWVLDTFHVNIKDDNNNKYNPYENIIFYTDGSIITKMKLPNDDYDYICICGKLLNSQSSKKEILSKDEYHYLLKEQIEDMCSGNGSLNGISKEKQRDFNETFPGLK